MTAAALIVALLAVAAVQPFPAEAAGGGGAGEHGGLLGDGKARLAPRPLQHGPRRRRHAPDAEVPQPTPPPLTAGERGSKGRDRRVGYIVVEKKKLAQAGQATDSAGDGGDGSVVKAAAGAAAAQVQLAERGERSDGGGEVGEARGGEAVAIQVELGERASQGGEGRGEAAKGGIGEAVAAEAEAAEMGEAREGGGEANHAGMGDEVGSEIEAAKRDKRRDGAGEQRHARVADNVGEHVEQADRSKPLQYVAEVAVGSGHAEAETDGSPRLQRLEFGQKVPQPREALLRVAKVDVYACNYAALMNHIQQESQRSSVGSVTCDIQFSTELA